jgi:hypothetical protein
LSGGKVLAFYSAEYATIRAKLYDGGWGSEETISPTTIDKDDEMFSVSVDDDDVVHVAFAFRYNGGALRKILYVQRSVAGVWSAEETVKAGDDSGSASPNISLDSRGFPYVASLWSDGLRIFKRRAANEWVEALIQLEKPSTGTLQPAHMTMKEWNKRIGIMFAEGTAAPYTIKFMPLTLLPSSLKSNSHTL